MPALLHDAEQACLHHFGKMPARGLRRDTGGESEFGRRQRAAIKQSRQNVGAGGIADQRRDFGELRNAHPAKMTPRSSKARRDELNDTGEAGKEAVLRDLRRVQGQAEADRSHTAALRSIELRGRRLNLWDGKPGGKKDADAPRSLSPAEVHGLPDTSK